jgi:flavin reductase (DIM6/NTAB) family NADH-FMN oxidoreductase RutF
MAFLLRFDGVNDYVDIPAWTPDSLSFNYELITTFSDGDVVLGNITAQNDGFVFFIGGLRVRHGGGFDKTAPLPAGTVFGDKLKIEVFSTPSGTDINITNLDSGETSTFLDAAFDIPTFNVIGRFQNGRNFDGDLYSASLTSGSDNRNYDPSASNGTGQILPDTVVGNDGTLVNFPTDNSQWIFYDDGGGAVTQPVVSVSAEEVHQANTLSISAFNSVSSIIAEQVESANLIDVFLSQLASSIQAQERHDATALNIEQSASQAVNSLTAEQIEQANLIGISQSLPVNSVQAQENQQANTLTIEQSAGQLIALNTAQQVEQATVLSLAQQQALAHIVAEQISAASVTDVSNLQAVTMIIAEESHQASTLNVEQYTGQLVTLITAEQKNEAQTLLISEVSAIDVLQAEQVMNAETIAFSQVQRLTQITAEQLTEAQLLTILTSGDNTDLSGLRLIPVTSKYTINPTNTTRYSLQKV